MEGEYTISLFMVCQCNMLLKCVGLLFSAGDNASK